MKLETFFDKFDQFVDAPDAVAKMRGLVRQLAVTGALVDQDKNDEPALALLDRIAAYKTSLAQQGKLRGSTTVVPIPPSEGNRILPSSWTWVRFGEVMVNRDGERIPVSKEERIAKAKTYDYYGASGVIDKIDGYLFDKPLLLIGEDGANLINRSTPIAFMARGQYWVNNHAHVLDGISDDFLRYIELYINAINLEPYVTGSAQPKMNQAKMNSIPIALPPLAEQKRIVAKVDELMALCDRLEAQQQERETQASNLVRASLARFADAPTPANLDYLFHPSYTIPPADLRKSILTLAVQGKLVPFDTDDVEQTVGDHIEFQNGYAFKSEWFKPSGMRLCRNTNVSHGVLDWRESAFVDDKIAKEFERFALSEGDIVLSLDRPLITTGLKVARVTKADLPCLLLQRVAKPVAKHDKLDLSYFLLWLNSSKFVDSIDPGRSNGVPHISTRQVQRLPFVLPPLAEQRLIVAKVEQLMALVDALETQLTSSRSTAAKLLSALVAELTSSNAKQ